MGGLEFPRHLATGLRDGVPDVTVQPSHGDAPFYNLIVIPAGDLCSDFEHVIPGPVGWDLASMGLDGRGGYDAAAAQLGLRSLDERLLRVIGSACAMPGHLSLIQPVKRMGHCQCGSVGPACSPMPPDVRDLQTGGDQRPTTQVIIAAVSLADGFLGIDTQTWSGLVIGTTITISYLC